MNRPRISRTLARRLAKGGMFLSLGLSLLLLVVMLASVRFQAAQVGSPFWRTTQVARGCVSVSWFTVAADGSRPGFGNPGLRVHDTEAYGLSLWPRAKLSGSLRIVVVPLWIPLAVFIGLALLSRRTAGRFNDPTRCGGCGYSLVGLPAAAPCPECGRARAFALARLWALVRVATPRRADRRTVPTCTLPA